ncbi:hypothetical protein XENTR_v10007384 [Xenopus tropicalis]|nr:hypothetical protein XENTR_v10007384 [Xenopus tropicalis]
MTINRIPVYHHHRRRRHWCGSCTKENGNDFAWLSAHGWLRSIRMKVFKPLVDPPQETHIVWCRTPIVEASSSWLCVKMILNRIPVYHQMESHHRIRRCWCGSCTKDNGNDFAWSSALGWLRSIRMKLKISNH